MRLLGSAAVFSAVIATAQSYALLGAVSGRSTCSADQFQCVTSNQCIPKNWRCDGDRDCPDGSDEDPTICHKGMATCPSDNFPCELHNGGTVCAPMHWRCNGKKDCSDGFDEDNCRNNTCTGDKFACKTGQCIQDNWACDGDPECSDGSDEDPVMCENRTPNCSSDMFACKPHRGYKRCLPITMICDGETQCADGSDEYNCENHTCATTLFACKSGSCILRKFRCDGDQNCPDGSDEDDCESATCLETEFACKSGQCISREYECDGDRDCADGSDEDAVICRNGTTGCAFNEFACRPHNGDVNCVPMTFRCDGDKDCPDGSDEVNCELRKCTDGEFACKYGGCIPHVQQCDGKRDCRDGSDEDTDACRGDKPCASYQFACKSSNGSVQCLAESKICDRQKDCADGSDERLNCSSAHCKGKDEVLCMNGHCILNHWKCDGQDDCGDGSDEKDCIPEGTNGDNMIELSRAVQVRFEWKMLIPKLPV